MFGMASGAGLSRERCCDNTAPEIRFKQAIGIRMKQDLNSASKTYNAFIASLKWSIPLLAALILLIMIMISE